MHFCHIYCFITKVCLFLLILSPSSKASREVANFTRKKIHTHLEMVSKNSSVCLSVAKFDLNYLRTGKIEWTDFFGGCQKSCPNFFSRQGGWYGLGSGPTEPIFTKTNNILIGYRKIIFLAL